MVEEIKKEETPTENFLSKLEELKQINATIEKNIAELKELKAYELMGGTSGLRPKEEPAHVETAKEYADRIMKNVK